MYCLELLGVEDDCRDDLAASAMSSLSSSRFRSRHILLKGICIALKPSRSDLCPSTTVSSSTSTGTLTDTGTITEVKLILHFKQDLFLHFKHDKVISSRSIQHQQLLPGEPVQFAWRTWLTQTLSRTFTAPLCSAGSLSSFYKTTLIAIPGSAWIEVHGQPQTNAQSAWRGARLVSGSSLTLLVE